MLDMSRAAGGMPVNRIVLRGMTWQHRRALDPLLGTLPAFRALHPAIDVTWDARPLAGLEFTPVAELAGDLAHITVSGGTWRHVFFALPTSGSFT
jgi:hypothetical protein